MCGLQSDWTRKKISPGETIMQCLGVLILSVLILIPIIFLICAIVATALKFLGNHHEMN